MPAPSNQGPTHRQPVASKQQVVRGILRGLMEGLWRGGDRFTEASAVEKFGVSRTPVREALLQLQGLGLIELRRNCGAVVLPFGTDEVRELYAVRSILEVEATRLAASRIHRELVDQLMGEFTEIRARGEEDPDWRLDRTLHQSIAEASGNHRLLAEIFRYGDLVQAMREIVGERTSDIHTTSVDEHLAILEALREGDPEGASLAMRNHLDQASTSAIEAIQTLRS